MRPMTSLINIFRILGNLTKALQTIYFKTTKHLNSFVSHCIIYLYPDNANGHLTSSTCDDALAEENWQA